MDNDERHDAPAGTDGFASAAEPSDGERAGGTGVHEPPAVDTVEDAAAALVAVSRYFASREPSSPVVALLERATEYLQRITQSSADERDTVARRSPPVRITYEDQVSGGVEQIELPFAVAVIANLSGVRRESPGTDSELRFFGVDADSFEQLMRILKPSLEITVPDYLRGERGRNLRVQLTFPRLESFSPTALLASVPILATLQRFRNRMSHAMVQSLGGGASPPGGIGNFLANLEDESDLADIVGALLPSSGSGALDSLARVIAELDKRVDDQLDAILHHSDFQALEASWRSLWRLVWSPDISMNVPLRVLSVSKQDLSRLLLEGGKPAFRDSPLYRLLLEDAGQHGPFGILLGDFYFDRTALDFELLSVLADVAADLHAPFIAGASARLAGLETWSDLWRVDLAAVFQTAEYAGWRSLRTSESARFLCLTVPRLLARRPYGTGSLRSSDLEFAELVGRPDNDDLLWSNAAYALAANIVHAHQIYRWCAAIEGADTGGTVELLDNDSRESGDSFLSGSPVETLIERRSESQLVEAGLAPLVGRRYSYQPVFFSVPTLHAPGALEQTKRVASDVESESTPTPLGHVLAACRVLHYLRRLAVQYVARDGDPDRIEEYLNRWISRYVMDPAGRPTLDTAAQYPLASARLEARRDEDQPEAITIQVVLKPHYQCGQLSAALAFRFHVAFNEHRVAQ